MKTSIAMSKYHYPDPKCQYCDHSIKQTTGKEIYPHREDLWHKPFYICRRCEAYVGCHPNTTRRLGHVANAEDRKLKMEAHEVFDTLWKEFGIKRGDAYAWLAQQMGVKKKHCHIGWFKTDQLKKVIEVSEAEATRLFGESLGL